MFRITGDEKLSFAFVNSDGENVNAAIDIDPSLEGATLYACFASEYGDNNFAAWANEEIDEIADGQTVGSYSIAIPDGARYFRLAAVKDGIATWSISKAIEDIEIVSGGALMAKITSTGALSKTALGVEFDYYGDGDASSVYDFELDYGPAANDLKWTETLAIDVSSLGHKVYAVDGLTPGKTYYAQLYGVSGDDRLPIGDVFSVTVMPEDSVTTSAYTGLWEIKKYSTNASDFDPLPLAVGSGELERHRESGIWAYAKPSWVSEIDGSENTWPMDAGYINCGFGYKGYMYMAEGKEYTFRVAMISQTVYIQFDSEAMYGQWMSNDPFDYYVGVGYSYTPTFTGWHPIHVVAVRDRSISSAQTEVAGFEFSNDGGVTWNQMADPGDGSLFRVDTAEPITVDTPSIVAGKLRATALFDKCVEGYDLYACFGDDYAGNDFDAWDEKVALAAVASDERMRNVSAPIPDGAAYCRLVAVKDGEYLWSDAEALKELPVAAEETLTASLVSIASVGVDSAAFNLNISIPESIGTECDVVFTVAPANGSWSFERVASGIAGGTPRVGIGGLRANRDYTITFHAENGPSKSVESEPVTITTRKGANLPNYAGLWQGRGTAWDRHWGQDIMGLETGTEYNQRCRQLGPMPVFHYWQGGAAYAWDNPFDSGTASSWVGDAFYVYEGYVWLQAGNYAFDYTIDAGVNLIIDDVSIANTYDSANHTASYACGTTGWHRFHFETQNDDYWGGAAGGLAGADSFRMSRNGGAWRQMLDPGDGSLFRVLPAFVCACGESGGVLTVSSDYAGDDTVKIVYGSVDGGDYPGSWENAEVLTFDEGIATLDYRSLGSGYARIFTVDGNGNCTSLSELVYLAAADEPALGDSIDADVSDGAGISVTAEAVSLGGGVAFAKLYLATEADFSDAELAAEAAVTSIGEIELRATAFGGEALVAEKDYHYSMVLASDSDAEDTLSGCVTMAGASQLASAVRAVSSGWNAVFYADVEKIGAGTTTLTLLTGAGADSLTNTSSRTVNSIGLNEIAVEFPFVNETVCYCFEISNPVGSSRSQVGTIGLVDNSVYYWNPAVTNGDWEDPANWVAADGGALDYRCTWPKTNQNAVRFDLATEPTTVAVAGDCYLLSLSAGAAEAKVKFVFKSTHPAVSQSMFTSFTDDASQTEFCLNVSRGQGSDYCIEQVDPVYNWATLFGNVPKAFRLSVSPESTARKGGSHDFAVLGWSYGINPAKVEFVNRGGVEFYFVYDGGGREPRFEGELPTQIRVSIVNAGMALFVR
ncbi:MAG: hypothetical protein ILO34_06215 [Kiritimatiellae bacterium]|nr:hypothetical protein [Kiritimatiellia bacterium]